MAPMGTVAVLLWGRGWFALSSVSEEFESELEAVSICTLSARLDCCLCCHNLERVTVWDSLSSNAR